MSPQQPPPQPAPNPPPNAPPQAPPNPAAQSGPKGQSGPKNPWIRAMRITSTVFIPVGLVLAAWGAGMDEGALSDEGAPVVISGFVLMQGGVIGLLMSFAVSALRWQPHR